MGVDINTYRSRVGCNRQNTGQDVVYLTVDINFSQTIRYLCICPLLLFIFLLFINQNVLFGTETYDLNILDLTRASVSFTGFHLCVSFEKKAAGSQCPGAVVFIGILLIIAGIESNPGPLPKKNENEEQITKNITKEPYPMRDDSKTLVKSSVYCGSTGEPFTRHDQTIPAAYISVLNRVMDSIGLISIKEISQDMISIRSTGTGFVVGDGYLMTACHVISDQIDNILETITHTVVTVLTQDDFRRWTRNYLDCEGLETRAAIKRYFGNLRQMNLESLIRTFQDYMSQKDYRYLEQVLIKKWYNEVTVKFGKLNEITTGFECTFSPDIPFLDEIIDVAILEIQKDDPGRQLPEGIKLDENNFNYSQVYILGYIKHAGGSELDLDPKCEVYTSGSTLKKDVTDAINWWKEEEKKEDEKYHRKYKKINIEEEYKNCVMQDGQVLLHTSPSFVHGTSGSPMIVCKKIGSIWQPEVVGIYLRGFPMFYYKIKKALENGDPLLGDFCHFNKFRDIVAKHERENFIEMRYFIEGGSTMKPVAVNLPDTDLRNMLFPNSISNDRSRTSRVEDRNYGEMFENSTEQSSGSVTFQITKHIETQTEQSYASLTSLIFKHKETQTEQSSGSVTFQITKHIETQTEQSHASLTSLIFKHKEIQTDDCPATEDGPNQTPFESFKQSRIDVLGQKAVRIRNQLGLEDYFPCKISYRDVIRISIQQNDLGIIGLHLTLLRKLIMGDFEARDKCPYELYKKELEQLTDDKTDSSENDSEDDSDDDANMGNKINNNILNIHDIFITVFNCCDPFLKQVLISKMFLFRLAVPLIYTTFQSHSLCFSLWPLRCIKLDFQERRRSSLCLAKYPHKVVSFVRFSRPNFSKSILLNAVLAPQQHSHHARFYNRDCYLGDYRREVTNGLVEASWYVPDGNSWDVFQDTIMFTNLRGDALDHSAQMKSLVEMSHCLVVIVSFCEITDILEYLKRLKKQCKTMILFITGRIKKPVLKDLGQNFEGLKMITCFDRNWEKNMSALRIEMQENISKQLHKLNDTSLVDCARCASKQDIHVDEWSGKCEFSRQDAARILRCMESFPPTDVKKRCLPLQDMWRHISQYTKYLKRTNKDEGKLQSVTIEGNDGSSLWTKEPIKNEIAKLRCDQGRLGSDSQSMTYMLIQILVRNISDAEYITYLLEWIRFYFDDRSNLILQDIMNGYHHCSDEYNKSEQKVNVAKLKNEMHIKEQNLIDAPICLNHMFREIGQIYESSIESKETETETFHRLPEIAAKLLILGYPLELLDGDAWNLPAVWIKSVFDSCIRLLGDKRVFIISILGNPCSGKSTFLNVLFGLKLPVWPGRCTTGAYVQMIGVDSTHGLPIDYLLVIDTEGLRAPERTFQRYDHDNELATLAVGVADLAIVNIKDENVSEINDVLQIVIHALLKLKLSNADLNFNTSCTLVHQGSNTSPIMRLQRLGELLNDATRMSAREIGLKNFWEVINFDIRTEVWHLPYLWNGESQMEHINPEYVSKVNAFKHATLKQIRSDISRPRSLKTTIMDILDLWNGILSEDFVFSFRNIREVEVFNNMEFAYRNATLALKEFQMDWIIQNDTRLGTQSAVKEFEDVFQKIFKDIYSKLEIYFDISQYKDELVKWKEAQLLSFRNFKDVLINKTKVELSLKRKQKSLQEIGEKMVETHHDEIIEEAKAIAKTLKGSRPTEQYLKSHFDDMWSKWLQKLPLGNHTDAEPLVNQIYYTLLDYKKQLQSFIHQQIRDQNLNKTVTCLSKETMPLLKKEMHFRIRYAFQSIDIHAFQNILKADMVMTDDNQVEMEQFQQHLFSSVNLQIQGNINSPNARFRNGHLDQLLNMIDREIDDHNFNDDNLFDFLPQYRAMMMVYVSRYVLHVYTKVHERYDRENSPTAIIEQSREATWRFFKRLIDEKTS